MKNTTAKYCSVALTGMVILYDFTHRFTDVKTTVYTIKPSNTTHRIKPPTTT